MLLKWLDKYGYALLGWGSVVMLAFAFYAQHVQHLVPCVLCVAQRVVLVFLLPCIWLASLRQRAFLSWLGHALAVIGLFAGLALSWRHHWLQMHPRHGGQCLPDVMTMWQYLSVPHFFSAMVHGDAECSRVTWRLLGLSVPVWLGAAYLGMLVMLLWLRWQHRESLD